MSTEFHPLHLPAFFHDHFTWSTYRQKHNQTISLLFVVCWSVSDYVTLDATPAADHCLLTTASLPVSPWSVTHSHLQMWGTHCPCETHTPPMWDTHRPCETHTLPMWDTHTAHVRHTGLQRGPLTDNQLHPYHQAQTQNWSQGARLRRKALGLQIEPVACDQLLQHHQARCLRTILELQRRSPEASDSSQAQYSSAFKRTCSALHQEEWHDAGTLTWRGWNLTLKGSNHGLCEESWLD